MQPVPGAHQLIAYGENPIVVLAKHIVTEHETSLPDLTHVTVLLNNPNQFSELRQTLLSQAASLGHRGILGPTVCSLRDYVAEHSEANKTLISDRARELLLYKALDQRQELFGAVSTWFLVDNLLTLFDELSANHYEMPQDQHAFTETLSLAYGLDNRQNAQALSREAKIVHTLWHAYQEELDTYEMADCETIYRSNLERLSTQPHSTTFYIAGYHRFLPSERHFLRHLDANNQITLFVHGDRANDQNVDLIDDDQLHSTVALQAILQAFDFQKVENNSSSYTHFLDNAYSTSFDAMSFDKTTQEKIGIKQRALHFAKTYAQSPASNRLRLCKNATAEHEAQAIALQLAHWHQQGKQRLAIITEDRRLARRVRALLERFSLAVNDYTGWALSTTSAAAAIDSWLNLIEQDFAYQPLLDLLKSPFVLPDWDRDTLSNTVFRFEQDIIRHENVQSNLSRYRFHIRSRQRRLQWQYTDTSQLLNELLDEIEHAAQPITTIAKSKNKTGLSELLNTVELSMQRIGLIATLQNDEAGQNIIEQLQTLQSIPESQMAGMTWLEFRQWLARALEQSYFQLSRTIGGIALLPINQSNLEQFDGLVIAAADANHLPMMASPSPLFNQSVRRELGLRTQTDELQTAFYHFRRLLESAPDILATYSTDNTGEPQTLAPWFELLNAFHQLAYNTNLHDLSLSTAARNLVLTDQAETSLPEKLIRPTPSAHKSLLPTSYSANTYQQLINCPYRFYAGQCLHLSVPEPIREALQKSDYGELVHRCLQAFHSDVKGLPGPLSSSLTIESRQVGIDLLNTIADKVFAADLEDNTLHRVWLERWRNGIASYIDWQTEHAANWSVYGVEHHIEIEPNDQQYGIKGRIDRVDSNNADNNSGDTIIDYKTGFSASYDDVMMGESIQLPFYALLWQRPTTQCTYVKLGDRVSETIIENDDLNTIAIENRKRLDTLHKQLQDGKTLPAWGDENVCQYCEFHGICRKQSWQTEPTPIVGLA